MASPALAQTGLATITGIVTDNSGGAVPGVTVTATNQATNVDYTGVTTDAGAYLITGRADWPYVIKVELSGFKSVESKVTLSAAQTARVDFKLEIGTIAETIEIVATGAVLQTENAVVGTSWNGSRWKSFRSGPQSWHGVALHGGRHHAQPEFVQRAEEHRRRPALRERPARAGQQFHARRRRLNDAIDNLVAYQPSPDALEQISVETNNYSPELGNVAGAVINMVVKSGTNRVSGNGFYYWRDNELAATPWATSRAGGKKADFNRKIFGGTLGGPVVKNKLFLFGDYQGGRRSRRRPMRSPPSFRMPGATAT